MPNTIVAGRHRPPRHVSSHRIVSLFSGIGGIELGFARALEDDVETRLFCEAWEPAQRVLEQHFPGIDIHPDVTDLPDLPSDTTLVTAGFPCTDLSQAGRTAGIHGQHSGLVRHVFRLLHRRGLRGHLPSLLIENVPNMLRLSQGSAMAYLVQALEELGYQWAYRVVDSRFTGLPQRRRRVILLASRELDPRAVLFSDDAGPRLDEDYQPTAFGYYWTEGRTGLGWGIDAVPTLKGGSTIGIPSPPAVWMPDAPIERRMIKPSITAGEALQGFDRGWTDIDLGTPRRGVRWKLIGNAVTAPVAQWIAERIAHPGTANCIYRPWSPRAGAWPSAAWGEHGTVWAAELSEFPRHAPYTHLRDLLDQHGAEPLSLRAATGFQQRLQRGNLGRHPGFRRDVADYIARFAPSPLH